MLFWTVPLIVLALVFTNEWHGLVWTSIVPISPEPGATLIYGHGPAVIANIVYSYVMILAGTLLLVRASLRSYKQFYKQTITLLLGSLTPTAGNMIYFLWLSDATGFDPTPFALAPWRELLACCTALENEPKEVCLDGPTGQMCLDTSVSPVCDNRGEVTSRILIMRDITKRKIAEKALNIDTAVPCGLIICELVSNSIKYGFTDNQPGEIRVSLTADGDRYLLKVSDNGAGIPWRSTSAERLRSVSSW